MFLEQVWGCGGGGGAGILQIHRQPVGMDEGQEPVVIGKVTDLPWISGGVSGLVLEVSDSAVIKFPCFDEQNQAEVERAIYDRLGRHPGITRLLSVHDGMVVLERLQYPLRKRLMDLRDAGRVPSTDEALRWASQVASALEYIHSRGVFQVDIGTHNILLDWDENVKLVDFAGSSIDGEKPTVVCGSRAEHPAFPAIHPSVQTEIFALGSVLYETETTRQPYHDKRDSEVEMLFGLGEFPETSTLLLGRIVSKCWNMEYKNAGEVFGDIKDLMGSLGTAVQRTIYQGAEE